MASGVILLISLLWQRLGKPCAIWFSRLSRYSINIENLFIFIDGKKYYIRLAVFQNECFAETFCLFSASFIISEFEAASSLLA